MASTVKMHSCFGRVLGAVNTAAAVDSVPAPCGTGLVPVLPQR
jgi:hypothetical protein